MDFGFMHGSIGVPLFYRFYDNFSVNKGRSWWRW